MFEHPRLFNRHDWKNITLIHRVCKICGQLEKEHQIVTASYWSVWDGTFKEFMADVKKLQTQIDERKMKELEKKVKLEKACLDSLVFFGGKK